MVIFNVIFLSYYLRMVLTATFSFVLIPPTAVPVFSKKAWKFLNTKFNPSE